MVSLPAMRGSADTIGYGGVHEGATTVGGLTFRHRHDWSSPKIRPLFLDLTHHERFFSAANDFSFVELSDGDRLRFRSPSPALTHLWISPDAQFLVGLSNVMLHNPYQLVVWRGDGRVLHREHISARVARLSAEQRREFAARFPDADRLLADRYFTYGGSIYLDYALMGVPNMVGGAAWEFLRQLTVEHPYSEDFSESVTDWVWWFDAKQQDLSIERNGAAPSLIVRSPSGNRIAITLEQSPMGASA